MKREYEKVWFISERKFLFELFLPQNCLIHFWLHFVRICNPFIRVREIGIWCTDFFLCKSYKEQNTYDTKGFSDSISNLYFLTF